MSNTIRYKYKDILSERIKIVLGIDLGHGESAGCYVKIRNNDGTTVLKHEIHLLKANSKGDTKIFSTIEYTDNGIVIGGDNSPNVIAYFKRSPRDWESIESISSKTYKVLMRDFLKKLTECLLSQDYTPELSNYSADEIAVFVGCPSDEVWINDESRTAYARLINEATGIETVCVVAESTAAIFSTVGSENKSLVLIYFARKLREIWLQSK